MLIPSFKFFRIYFKESINEFKEFYKCSSWPEAEKHAITIFYWTTRPTCKIGLLLNALWLLLVLLFRFTLLKNFLKLKTAVEEGSKVLLRVEFKRYLFFFEPISSDLPKLTYFLMLTLIKHNCSLFLKIIRPNLHSIRL